ncbi:hypothetical protein INT43_005367 [Umbelopsis isabellina]|uniref:Phosphotransferase n=1 Tax=Mortierella isabellina TaxID=91625 RepID=A0A8H7PME8_MORIS|nr:hypothetical protein INT43_005367 [Umbelopsis isabellina]
MSAWLSRKVSAFTIHDVDGSEAQKEAVNYIAKEFEVSTENLRTIVKQFNEDIDKGLQRHGATVAMIPSFVQGRPTGQEKGKYLALDLGGTNLRVCEVNLLGDSKVTIHQQKFVVSNELKTGEMRHLCDYIADCVDSFLTENGSDKLDSDLQLGFTFSFPVNQTAINRGTLMQWTKGFDCHGAIGKDVVIMLQDSFRRKNLNVNIAAIVNDTVGTLMANGYRDPKSHMGVILGTGTNAAYYEKMEKILKWDHGEINVPEMAVNMEWGAFDNERRVIHLTPYDNKLDRESINPRFQIYEKLISGMYLGEIARNVLLHLIDRTLLFNGLSSIDLNKQWSFETAYMSTIEADATQDLSDTQHVLESILAIPTTTLIDRQIVKKVCEFVGVRAARLSAAGLGAVLSHCNKVEEGCTIAIDGSVFEFYPNFADNMMAGLKELFGDQIENKVKFSLARDGSGLGAAVIAMMAHNAPKI